MTQELAKELFDYKDGLLYWKVRACNNVFAGDLAGGIKNNKGDIRRHLMYKRKSYPVAKIIFLIHKGYLPAIVDHKDRNPLNDNIENLREATPLQNAANRTKVKTTKSKYLGVTPIAKCKTWRAIINVNGKQKYIGAYQTENEAGLAYNREAIRYHGEFANLNVIEQ